MSNNPAELALEIQQMLVEDSLPLVFSTYEEAIAGKIADPLIVLIDCEDELGGQIARGWLGDDAVANAIAVEKQSNDNDSQTTVYARAISWKEGQQELSQAFPYLADSLASGPPKDAVMVIGITAGGASALAAPLSANEPSTKRNPGKKS